MRYKWEIQYRFHTGMMGGNEENEGGGGSMTVCNELCWCHRSYYQLMMSPMHKKNWRLKSQLLWKELLQK